MKNVSGDHPLLVQFAAKRPEDFAAAAELVSPYAEGVDLNCGCPQRLVSRAIFSVFFFAEKIEFQTFN